jgi:hypothetical protein
MGTRDLEKNPRARTFLIAGTHGGSFRTPVTPGACVQPRNHDAYPAACLLVALDEWVSRQEPPASLVRGSPTARRCR